RIQEAPLLEVANQPGCRLIDLRAERLEPRLDVGVVIPRRSAGLDRRHELNETNAGLDELASHQTACAEICRHLIVEPVKLPRLLSLAAEIEHLLDALLHAGGKLVVENSGVEVGLGRKKLTALGVELFELSQIALLRPLRQFGVGM